VWSTSEDERVCPTCGPLNGVIVAMDAEFEKGGSVPPAHPMCRCCLLYEVQGEARPATAPVPAPASPKPVAAPEPEAPDVLEDPPGTPSKLTRKDIAEVTEIVGNRVRSFEAEFAGLDDKALGKKIDDWKDGLRKAHEEVPVWGAGPKSNWTCGGTKKDKAEIGQVLAMLRPSARRPGEYFLDADTKWGGKRQGRSVVSGQFQTVAQGRGKIKIASKLYGIGYIEGSREGALWHEVGHFIENQNSRALAASLAFRTRRRMYRQEFISGYADRGYADDRATEIISVGLEQLAEEKTAVQFWKDDPEHFALVAAVLEGRFGYGAGRI
jgi:hypothetical protein